VTLHGFKWGSLNTPADQWRSDWAVDRNHFQAECHVRIDHVDGAITTEGYCIDVQAWRDYGWTSWRYWAVVGDFEAEGRTPRAAIRNAAKRMKDHAERLIRLTA